MHVRSLSPNVKYDAPARSNPASSRFRAPSGCSASIPSAQTELPMAVLHRATSQVGYNTSKDEWGEEVVRRVRRMVASSEPSERTFASSRVVSCPARSSSGRDATIIHRSSRSPRAIRPHQYRPRITATPLSGLLLWFRHEVTVFRGKRDHRPHYTAAISRLYFGLCAGSGDLQRRTKPPGLRSPG